MYDSKGHIYIIDAIYLLAQQQYYKTLRLPLRVMPAADIADDIITIVGLFSLLHITVGNTLYYHNFKRDYNTATTSK